MQLIIMTSDGKEKIVQAFLHQWHRYYIVPCDIIICGFIPMQVNTAFYPIGRFNDFPANRWSDALIQVLDTVADDLFILMLDDYWLVRQTDIQGIKIIYDYMQQFQNVIKFDLTSERLYADGGGKYLFNYNSYNVAGHLDLIKSDFHSPYHMSLWGGMWRRDLLQKILVPGETAQQIELNGTHRLAQYGDELLVLGTRQSPLKHANVIQGGAWNQDNQVGLPALSEDDKKALKELGYV